MRDRGLDRKLGLAVSLVLWTLSGSSGCAEEPARPPHLVLVTIDTLRSDHLSVNGYARPTSPAIDAFAARARNFTNAVTVIPKTGPSIVTVLSGLHPQQHGVQSNNLRVPDDVPRLPAILREHGYRTVAFVGNGVLNRERGYARGFDVFELHMRDPVQSVKTAALAFISKPWPQPTFLWLHFVDPHGPYEPPPGYLGLFDPADYPQGDARVPLEYEPLPRAYGPNKVLGALPRYQRQGDEDRISFYASRYDAEIRYTDSAFGEVIDALEREGLFEKSGIILLADHGESLDEHDFYFEHGWYAYEPTLHIPLIVKAPGEPRPGTVMREQVSVLDVFPTMLRLAGLADERGLAGDCLLGSSVPARPLIIESSGAYPEKFLGLRYRDFKYLRNARTGHEELYDLSRDPAELVNLASLRPAQLESMRRIFDRALEALGDNAVGGPQPTEVQAPEILENLRSLGYVD